MYRVALDYVPELEVRIRNKEGRVDWVIPDSIRAKIAAAARTSN